MKNIVKSLIVGTVAFALMGQSAYADGRWDHHRWHEHAYYRPVHYPYVVYPPASVYYVPPPVAYYPQPVYAAPFLGISFR